jgi:hypothetical protein
MTDREVMQQALEALTIYSDAQCSLKGLGAITALRRALEQPEQGPTCPECKAAVLYECVACSSNNYPPKPEQEPVACVIDGDLYFHHEIDWEDLAYQGHGVELLYTTPPAAQRQPLPFDAVQFKCRKHLWIHASRFEDAYMSGFRDAEAAHGIKEQP